MLNELYILAESLERCKIDIPNQHKDLKKNPNENGFILSISEIGLVSSISFCGKEQMKEYWKIDSGENGVSFPGFKLSGPIWNSDDLSPELLEEINQLDKADTQKREAIIKEAVENSSLQWNSLKDRQRHYFKQNLNEFPSQLKDFFDKIPAEFEVITHTLENISKFSLTEDFLESLSESAIVLLKQSDAKDAVFSQLVNLLFGKWDSKKKHFTVSKTTVIVEAENGFNYHYSITHHKTEDFINQQLNLKLSGSSFASGGKGAEIKSGIDSYSGEESDLQTRFPDPNLPILGITKLMSMTKDSLCQTRYGLQESDTFPVGKHSTQKILNALNFLTDKNRQGKSWKGVSNSEEGGKDLLLVYLDDKPQVEINLADYFVGGDVGLAMEASFEEIAAKVCSALEGKQTINQESLLRVIVLTSRDKGRKQISLNESYQVKNVFGSAEDWIKAGENLPKILVPIKLKNQKKKLSARCPHPVALLKCINTHWTNKGTMNKWLSNCNLGQIYEIFLKKTPKTKQTAKRLLSMALKSNYSIFLSAGNKLHELNKEYYFEKTGFTLLNAVSTLGILLYKIGHLKENFMKKTPYNIGRLLALSDQLHALYCNDVRDKGLPPKLLGNALMNTALQKPDKAMSLFGQRILPYQAWAKTLNSGENVGLAKYFLKEIGKVSQTISEAENLPTSLTDAERAEMILGYLARNEQNEKQK